MVNSVNALILAGQEHSTNKLGVDMKALIDINGRPMIQYVTEVLEKCEVIDKIAVVGPYSKLHNILGDCVDYILDANGTIIHNTIQGLSCFDDSKPVLICTSDIPMLTSEAVNDFIRKSQKTQAHLCYPIVEKSLNEQEFPEIQRTYVKIKDGVFTGGNVFYIYPEIAQACSVKAEQLIAHRKNAFKMAKVLGWKTMLLFLFKRLTIMQAEQRFKEIFNIIARAIISTYPELANDVDKPSDLEYVKKRFSDIMKE